MTNVESKELTLTERQLRRAEVRNVIAMSIPVVITTTSRAFMDIVDYVMITRLELTEAQAAILPSQILMWSYIIAGLGIVSVVNTFASQSLGKKQYRECSGYAWQSLYLAVFFGLIALALRPMLPALIAACGHEPKVQALELAYTRVALLTVAPTIAANGLAWFFVGIHRPWVTMWSAIEANIVNVAVSYVLIFGLLGFEAMGIAGAAWGTLAAVVYRTLRLMLSMVTPTMALRFHSRQTWAPSWARIRDLLRVGLPCGLQWFCDVVVWAIFVSVLVGAKFGTVHLIATNTAWQFMRLAFMPAIGVGQALTALVGKSIGAGQPARAIRETRIAVLITLAYMGTLSVIYLFKGPALIRLFNSDPEVVRIGAMVMICAAVFQLFDAIAITYCSALRGAGDTFVPSMFFVIGNWVIIIGGGSAVAAYRPQYGSLGPWVAASSLIVVSGVFLWWRWHSRVWMKINLLHGSTEDRSGPAGVDEEAVMPTGSKA